MASSSPRHPPEVTSKSAPELKPLRDNQPDRGKVHLPARPFRTASDPVRPRHPPRGSDHDLRSLAHDIQAVQRAHRRLRLTLRGTEGREIVAAYEVHRRLLHRVRIETVWQPPNAVTMKDRRRPAREYPVDVVACHSTEPSIERGRYVRAVEHGARRGSQMVIDRVLHTPCRPFTRKIDVRNLA